jgi:hypothetical protein
MTDTMASLDCISCSDNGAVLEYIEVPCDPHLDFLQYLTFRYLKTVISTGYVETLGCLKIRRTPRHVAALLPAF